MSTASIRQIKLARLRAQLKDDTQAAAAFAALSAHETAEREIAERRQALVNGGRHTDAGIAEELKELRARHAKALREAQGALQTSAEKLLAAAAPRVDLPGDAERVLDHYLAQPRERQLEMRLAALSGRDDVLARVLVAPQFSRYTEVSPEVRRHIEQRLTPADPAHSHRAEAHALAHAVVNEALQTLET
jgi:hypothetical protein